MRVYFLDSSALTKRFIRETGSSWVLRLLRPKLANTIYIARITPVEVIAGLARQVRVGTASIRDLDQGEKRLTRWMSSRNITVDIDLAVINIAIVCVRRYGLRGYDAIQLGAAVNVNSSRQSRGAQEMIFVSADDALNAAAMAEGLVVENPNDHL